MIDRLLIYDLKVAACLALFWLFFRLLLSRETFHRLNRIVLLGGMALSFLLPLCVITLRRELSPLPVDLPTVPHRVVAEAPDGAAFPWRELAGLLLLTGAVASFVWRLGALVAVWRLIRRGRRERLDDGCWLVRVSRAVPPFSWGRFVVLSDSEPADGRASILAHERAHVRLHHTFDLLLADLAGCLQWFNPAMWLLRRELRQIHEYEADEAVLRSGVDARSYQMLLVKKAVGGRWYSVANSLNHSNLKKRITMMLRKRSSRRARARVLLLLPLVGLALGAFAETRYVIPDDKDTKEIRTIRISGSQISTSGIEGKPLILVNGERVASLDSIRPEQIVSVTVRKDSLTLASYGEEARDGVILVELRRPGEKSGAAAADSLAGFRTKVESSSDGTTTRITLSGSPSTLSGSISALEGNPAILVDGKPFHGDLNTLSPDRIGSVTVYKGNIPEAYRQYVGPENQGLIVIGIKPSEQPAFDDRYFRSDAWKEAQEQLSDLDAYFGSDAWKEGMKRLSEMETESEALQRKLSGLNPDSEEWQEAQRKLAELGAYFESDEWKEAQHKLRQLSDRLTPQAGNHSEVPYNTVVGQHGGMLVTGPEVMSKSRTEEGRSVTMARGRVTADFSEIDEADYRIEIDGKPAAKTDLERIEPGKIRRVESISPDAASGRKGELRVRTRK